MTKWNEFQIGMVIYYRGINLKKIYGADVNFLATFSYLSFRISLCINMAAVGPPNNYKKSPHALGKSVGNDKKI